jgi:hypothetical protein
LLYCLLGTHSEARMGPGTQEEYFCSLWCFLKTIPSNQ